ncbi:hypothetical protein [Halosimplex marinum]|uniref:hypothetical protein n=1 Tax=Halosimplex marinum TaxID=3396620 RepID=UPI003F579B92
MHTQVLEFDYEANNVEEIQSQLDSFHEHYTVRDVEVTQWESQILVFLFCED